MSKLTRKQKKMLRRIVAAAALFDRFAAAPPFPSQLPCPSWQTTA